MKEEKGSIVFGRRLIKFGIKRSKRRRTVSLFVDPYEGIFLRVPYGCDKNILSKLVHSKAVWVLEKQRLIDETKEFIPRREFASGETFLYLGRQLRLKIISKKEKLKPELKVIQGCFTAILNSHYSESGKRRVVRKMLFDWYRKHAKTVLSDRASAFSKKMDMLVPDISLASQSKRWGICSTKGRIRFNWHIVMAPVSLVDYVVAHEMCHLKYGNHSQDFWKLLGSIMPDYEIRRNRLRKEGPKFFF